METELRDDFAGIDFTTYLLPLIVIYDHPLDFPDQVIARLWDLEQPTEIAVAKDTVDDIVRCIPPGFVTVKRHPRDQNHIVESFMWMGPSAVH